MIFHNMYLYHLFSLMLKKLGGGTSLSFSTRWGSNLKLILNKGTNNNNNNSNNEYLYVYYNM